MRTAGELCNFRRIMQMCLCCEVAWWIMRLCRFDLKRKTTYFFLVVRGMLPKTARNVDSPERIESYWCINLFWCLQSHQPWETDHGLLSCKILIRHVLSGITSGLIKRQVSFYLLFHWKTLNISVLGHCPSRTVCNFPLCFINRTLEVNMQSERRRYFWWLMALPLNQNYLWAGGSCRESCRSAMMFSDGLWGRDQASCSWIQTGQKLKSCSCS